MFIKIVGLNDNTFFYLVKECGSCVWKQYEKNVDDFIKMMFILFPDLAYQCRKNQFFNKYQIANWLYNYGESEDDKMKGNAYMFFYHR